MATPARSDAGEPKRLLGAAASWGYQLQDLDIAEAAGSTFDLIVIDYSRDGSEEGALKPAEIERLRRKPDGNRRLVVAYLSIGEAESYRPYWRAEWSKPAARPDWLLGENPEWPENYSVCFWDPAWQRLFYGAEGAYVDRIIEQGFDGVYLDKCDVYEDLKAHFPRIAAGRATMERDMVEFVSRLLAHARSRRPGFLAIMQNAEGLLEHADLRQTLDAVAKEELYFGVDKPEKPNSAEDVTWSRDALSRFAGEGKPVFVVEYLDRIDCITTAARACSKDGFVLHIARKDRELDELNVVDLIA